MLIANYDISEERANEIKEQLKYKEQKELNTLMKTVALVDRCLIYFVFKHKKES